MPRSNRRSVLGVLFAFAFTMFTLANSASAQTESILYTFTAGSDGSGPTGNLVFDAAGNLYGTTDAGGVNDGNGGKGVVFKLSPAVGGGWTETPLYAFQGGNSDGEVPFGGVVFDAAGNMYGVTNAGGIRNLGTIYELSPVAGGGWTESVIYKFRGGTDGANPNGGLAIDSAGNLYGTTPIGGAGNQGTVFQLSPSGSGSWTETVILNGSNARGGGFNGSVLVDGNLYVPARTGGAANGGSIYQLTFAAGAWRSGVIYTFLGGADGSQPTAGLVVRNPGHLFGTTEAGGSSSSGTLFELTKAGGGAWTKTILHNFGVSSKDGLFPTIPLTVGPTTQLYGADGSGGIAGNGTAFEFADLASGWNEKILDSFSGSGDGGPGGGLVFDGAGNIYGVMHNGGAFGAGSVYEIVP
jgi:uncharacterized repeat protein (TIGR03803 family)